MVHNVLIFVKKFDIINTLVKWNLRKVCDCMIWVIGIISVLGIAIGIYSLTKIGKGKGIAELLLAILCPAIAILFGSLQDGRAFGGTKLEFFIHSATVDGDIWPWILLALLIAEVICIVRTVCMVAREKK